MVHARASSGLRVGLACVALLIAGSTTASYAEAAWADPPTKQTRRQAKAQASSAAAANADGKVADADKKAKDDAARAQRDKLRASLDSNSDGVISGDEWKAALADWKSFEDEMDEQLSRTGEARQRFMQRFDSNGDGKLDDKEKAAARKWFDDQRLNLIAEFDKDGDGKLSDEERKAMREALVQRAKAAKDAKDGAGNAQGSSGQGSGSQGPGPAAPSPSRMFGPK